MKKQTCCFTGHRIIPKEEYRKIQKLLETELVKLIRQGVRHFGCGGAIGFDQLAGFTILKLKEQFPYITLIMVLPCADQDKKWRQIDKDRYQALLAACDKKVCLQQNYDSECMLKRNRHLIDNSGACVAYLTQLHGGTFYTVNYARRQGVPVFNIGVQPLPFGAPENKT